MIKLLMVDDSGFMRIAIRKMVEDAPDIKVVGEAKDGASAIHLARETKPDVITMDIEMPGIDGLEATQRILENRPVPIIMLSSLTKAHAPATIKALSIGAVDYISKASSFVQLDIVKIQKELLDKVRYWARRGLLQYAKANLPKNSGISSRKTTLPPLKTSPTALPPKRRGSRPQEKIDLALVGISTGGPRMLPEMLKAMGKLNIPLVVAQHMPEAFTGGFADHLRVSTGLDVLEGKQSMTLKNGQVVILPGGTDAQIKRSSLGTFTLKVVDLPQYTFHPSVDALLESACQCVKHSAVAVIMTGMGEDGLKGARLFDEKAWPILAQAPETCVVDGMPGAVLRENLAWDQLPPSSLGRRLALWINMQK
ncbi:chemotaxis-specific protein-glutamate methyltransferase CheB [Magnetococcales bacterium HHB-1]